MIIIIIIVITLFITIMDELDLKWRIFQLWGASLVNLFLPPLIRCVRSSVSGFQQNHTEIYYGKSSASRQRLKAWFQVSSKYSHDSEKLWLDIHTTELEAVAR